MRIAESQLRRIIREEILREASILTNSDGTRSPYGRLLGTVARYEPRGLDRGVMNPREIQIADELEDMGYLSRGLVGAGYVAYNITDAGRSALANI